MDFRRILVLGGLILSCLAIAGQAQAGQWAEIQARGQLTLLCFPNMRTLHAFVDLDKTQGIAVPLTELRDPEYFLGVEIDLVKRFAREMGLGLEIKAITTSYGDLIQALVDGQGDVLASSLTITEERERILDFTVPFSYGWISVVVPQDSTVATWEDLQGLRGAVMEGSSQMEYLKARGLDGVKLVLTQFSYDSLEALDEGRADFALMDTTVRVGQSPDPISPALKVAFHLQRFGYGMAVPEGSDLKPALDAFLTRMIESGEVDRLEALYNPGRR